MGKAVSYEVQAISYKYNFSLITSYLYAGILLF